MNSLVKVLGAFSLAICTTPCRAETEYLSDVVLGISTYPLDYTRVMGLDTAAYPLWPRPIAGERLTIKGKTYAKGIGAPYAPVTIVLDGKYDRFDAKVGVQSKTEGTVVFQVIVDGKIVFDSGPMTENDEPKTVRVALAGAMEMRLSAAGNAKGDWVDARLTRALAAHDAGPVDMAPFARVCTWDPARRFGVAVTRLEEFPAADVFPETVVVPTPGDVYTVPAAANGRRCIGLQWMEQRRICEVGLQFAGDSPVPAADGVRIEGWVLKDPLVMSGHSEWQGKWTAIQGKIEKDRAAWVMRIQSGSNREVSQGTYKIRWIFPPSPHPIRIKRFTACTTSVWSTTEVVLESERRGRGEIEIYNGEFIEPAGSGLRRDWDLGKSLRLKVHYTSPRPWGYDRTVLRVRLPGSAFGVAIDDLLANACVYVKDAGFFASSGIAKRDMASYRASIKGRETYLDQIRRMPDQKFGNALKALYIRAQDRSPTMLSLACDNRKAVVDRAGQIGFGPMWMQPSTQLRSKHMITPTFGSGANLRLSDGAVADCPGYTRSMENGWMPIPQITIKEGPLAYRETVFVAPADRKTPGAGSPSPVNARPLCAAEYVVENSQAAPAAASFKLAFMADTEKGVAALVRMDGHRVIVTRGDKLLAIVGLTDLKGLRAEVKGSELALRGTLAAGQTARCWAYAPLEWDAKAEELADGENLHAAAASYWQRLIAQGMKIDIPDKLLQNLIDASQAHCMIAARTTDAGKCIEPWIAAAYYGALDTESHSVIHGMDMLGQGDFARRALDYFLKRENPVGYLSHGYTMMGTGQHLWFLSDHYRLTGDSRWWRDVSPKVANICQWIDRQCRKTMRKDPFGQEVPEFGLVPPGTVADWQDWGYIFSMEGYYYAGLSRAARALAEIGHPKAEELAQAAERFKGDILRAYHWTQARAPVVPRGDGTWVPWYPMRLYKPGPCEQFFPNYNGSWLYDVELGAHHMVDEGVLDPQSAEVAWMADNMENVQFMKDSATSAQLSAAASQQDWFNRGGFPKCQPYYGRYLELCALRDDVKPFLRSYFNQLAAMFNREDLSIYENPGASVWNKTHETGHFLQQTRLMFVMERGDELWLAPFVTNQWIKDGMTVAIGDALSYFGPVSYSIRSHVAQGYIEATVDRPIRKLPKALVVRLRHPDGKQMSRVTVNGRVWTDFDVKRETVRIEHPEGRVTVTAYFY